jgi:hypothetical protein
VTKDFLQALKSEVGLVESNVFVVVDALDERAEDGDAYPPFISTLRSLCPTVRVIVTSRELFSIQRAMRDSIRLEIRADLGDIQRYVQDRLTKTDRLMRLLDGENGAKMVISNVTDKSKGM